MVWTNPRTWNAGETVTATLLNTHLRDNLNILKTYVNNDGSPAFVKWGRQSGDITKNNSAVLADLTGLNFAIGANENWFFLAWLFTQSASATPGMKFTFTGPAAPTEVLFGVVDADGAQLTAGYINAFGSTVAITRGTIDGLVILGGICRNGVNAGTIQGKFAQNTATAANSIVKAGSHILAIRMI